MKERNETHHGNFKNNEKYTDKLRREKKQAKEDIEKILPTLKKDPDWTLVSGDQKPTLQEDSERKSRALIRLTKKAVNLLLPEYKSLACHGKGSARSWINVNIIMPQNPEYTEEREIVTRVDNMLLATGMKYSTYLTDYGPNNYNAPCLHVGINDISYGH